MFLKRDPRQRQDLEANSFTSPQMQSDIHSGWRWRRVGQGAIALFIAILLLLLFPMPVHATLDTSTVDPSADSAGVLPVQRSESKQLFESNCAGCHAKGGNIIRRGKTLKLRALQRNHMDSVEAIQAIVTQGKNNMSAYGDRLSSDEIEAVSVYVWQQAQAGWPRP